MKRECVAMILAGGQGTRLGGLTKFDAKPAVPFAGKYKIIDFSLTNCAHSGLDTIGVLTQYQPLHLNSHVLHGSVKGVHVLPPYVGANGQNWYKGTANAIYQNIEFIEKYNAKYVIVLSGDHIYKMDYRPMIDFHKEKGGAATIAVMSVPIEEANRFGIMNTDDDAKIVEFEEKPANPKSNLASMGVYVFTWDKLRKHLIMDENTKDSSNDFGKNVIPQMLANEESVFAYEFAGYWKDVGTIESLWQANMDLLSDNPELMLDDDNWKMYSKNHNRPPHFVGENASVRRSYISDGCRVYGSVFNSIIFQDVIIEPGAMVSNSVILPGSIIGKNAQVERSIIGTDARIEKNCRIGIPGAETVQYQNELCTGNVTLISPKISVCQGIVIGQGCMVDSSITSYMIDVLNTEQTEECEVNVG